MRFGVALGAALAVFFCCGITAPRQTAAAPAMRLVARTSTSGDTPTGPPFTTLNLPSTTDAGSVVFRGSGSGFTGVYASGGEGVIVEIARSGMVAPGVEPELPFSRFYNAASAGGRRALFVGRLAGSDLTPINDNGLWTNDQNGVLRKVMRGGDPVPELGSEIYFDAIIPPTGIGLEVIRQAANSVGDVAFYSGLHGPGARDINDRAIFLSTPTGLQVIARRGDPVPGATDGALISNFLRGRSSPSLNDRGDVAFAAGLEQTLLDHALFVQRRGEALALVARTGSAAPSLGDEVTFKYLSDANLNNAGRIAFQATLQGAGVGLENNLALFAGWPEQLSLVARNGTAAPGTDAVFANFGPTADGSYPPLMNAAGRIAIVAQLTGPGVDPSNDSGIWAQDVQGQLQLIAREGSAAPGGGVFDDFAVPDPRIQLTAAGRVAFLGRALIDDPIHWRRGGIWSTDSEGTLVEIAREGKDLQFREFGEVSTARPSRLGIVPGAGGEDGSAGSYSDRGELVFWMTATSNQGSFQAIVVVVPEPANAWPWVLTIGVNVLRTGKVRSRAR